MANLKGLFSSERDDWETPQVMFDELHAKNHFTLDAASSDMNAKLPKHYTLEDSGLDKSWEGERVFCNPPYGREVGKWVKKCAEEAHHAFIVLLIPARTDTSYFHEHIYGNPNARIEFLRGRLKFERGGISRCRTVPFHARVFRRGESEWLNQPNVNLTSSPRSKR